MKYAAEQLVRPQHENGCDYGHGRRSVLVRNGKRELLHVAGSKHWAGVGAGQRYSSAEIVIYPDERGACKQYTLAEGRMNKQRWMDIAEQVYKHLGVEPFDLGLISWKDTLLLDEPGEVTEPPPRDPGPKKVHPRIESDKFYRVFLDDENECKLVEFPIVKQVGGVIFYKLPNGREVDKKTMLLLEAGAGGTREEAIAAYLQYYKEQVAEAIERTLRAAHHYAYADDNLTEAKDRIKAMLKKEDHEQPEAEDDACRPCEGEHA